MGAEGCPEAMQLLNFIFSSGIIFNDGHEIRARLHAGDDVAAVVEDLGRKFGDSQASDRVKAVIENWPPLHVEGVSHMVKWALDKLDTEDRVMIRWKGDAEHHETVTRLELRDHTLEIEFAHPPAAARAGPAGA